MQRMETPTSTTYSPRTLKRNLTSNRAPSLQTEPLQQLLSTDHLKTTDRAHFKAER